jgi:hypothetical protein
VTCSRAPNEHWKGDAILACRLSAKSGLSVFRNTCAHQRALGRRKD